MAMAMKNTALVDRCNTSADQCTKTDSEHRIAHWIAQCLKNHEQPAASRRARRNAIIAALSIVAVCVAEYVLIGNREAVAPIFTTALFGSFAIGFTYDTTPNVSGPATELAWSRTDPLLRFAVRIRDAAQALRVLVEHYQQWHARCAAQLEEEQPGVRKRYEQLLTRTVDRLDLATAQFWSIVQTQELAPNDPEAIAAAIAAIDPECNGPRVRALLDATPDPAELLTAAECTIEALDELERDVPLLAAPMRA
jgi:hypothetical protein